MLDGRRRPDRRRHRARAAAARGAVRADGGRCRLSARRAARGRGGGGRGRAGRAGAAAGPGARRLRDERRARDRARAPAAAARARAGDRRRRRGAARRSSAPRSPGPGFVNLFVTDAFLAEALGRDRRRATAAARPSGRSGSRSSCVSANPTGPITVASARNGAYGDSVARLLEFAGHDGRARVLLQRRRRRRWSGSARSVEAVRRGEPSRRRTATSGAYIDELAAPEGDPVPQMLERIEASLERFRDPLRHVGAAERRWSSALPELLPRLDTYEADGAVWARSSAYGDDEDRVAVRSRDGDVRPTAPPTSPTVADKLERGFDRAIYVLGADHHGTPATGTRPSRAMLGYDPERVEVLLYQLVHLTRGGEATKVSKRRGDVVFLDDFVDEIGVDAARWYLVSRGHDQTIEIDVDLAAEKTQKNPVYYVQYAHARIAGILRNAGDAAVGGDPPRPARPVRSATSSSGSPSSRPSSPRRPSAAARMRCRCTRSASPTTSTASTTSAACSARRRRPSGSASAARRQAGDRAQPRPDRRRGSRAHVTFRHKRPNARARLGSPRDPGAEAGPQRRARARPRHRGGRARRRCAGSAAATRSPPTRPPSTGCATCSTPSRWTGSS